MIRTAIPKIGRLTVDHSVGSAANSANHDSAEEILAAVLSSACGGAHFLGRALREQRHEVRLAPAQYVKPYVKTNKTDYIDAEAIAEAVARPTMRFEPIKTDD